MELIKLRVYNVGNKGSININPKLIETVIVSPYNDKYILILALSQGARYQLATSEGKYLFDTKEEAEAELNTILEEVTSENGGSFYGELDAGEFGEAFTGELDAGEFV